MEWAGLSSDSQGCLSTGSFNVELFHFGLQSSQIRQPTISKCYNQSVNELLKKMNAPKFHKD